MLSVNAMASLSNSKLSFQYYYYHYYHNNHSGKCFKLLTPKKSEVLQLQIRASSSAAPDVDLKTLESAISKKDSGAVKEALDQLSEVGWAKKWSSQPYVSRRTTSLRELTTLGIKNAENLAIPSVRNDAAFLFTVVGTTGFLGVLAGQLPGDWGFFLPYLIGSISLVVLAVGSISPGLLQAAIGGFSSFFPDYQERIARHEAAHFLSILSSHDILHLAICWAFRSWGIHWILVRNMSISLTKSWKSLYIVDSLMPKSLTGWQLLLWLDLLQRV
ncbi:uncharacterized protein LOC111316107 isoform X2 [Durio zibethinus]|uniref:Uncharacterized protein LOC111316107 isoform X2 n=1 Tax=Durio zibethinus TaxID=66656 RepID=A0A6P6B9K3_DURZI|nr:uncharacterized protein LOC111316107 isoform X2 [Durio zibethinus]